MTPQARRAEIAALVAAADMPPPVDGSTKEEKKAWAYKWTEATRAYCRIVTPKVVADLLAELARLEGELARLTAQVEELRAALEQCGQPFTLWASDEEKKLSVGETGERLGVELCRRMSLANNALAARPGVAREEGK